MRKLTAEELAALEIIRRGEEAVTGIQGTFNGEDAIFIVQVSAAEGTDELRIYPLAMLLRDEDMRFVGGPHEQPPVGPEHAWPDGSATASPSAWPEEGVVAQPAARPGQAVVQTGAPVAGTDGESAFLAAETAKLSEETEAAAAAATTPLRRLFGRRRRAAAPPAGPEEARLAEEARRAEEARLAEEARRAEEARLAEEARRGGGGAAGRGGPARRRRRGWPRRPGGRRRRGWPRRPGARRRRGWPRRPGGRRRRGWPRRPGARRRRGWPRRPGVRRRRGWPRRPGGGGGAAGRGGPARRRRRGWPRRPGAAEEEARLAEEARARRRRRGWPRRPGARRRRGWPRRPGAAEEARLAEEARRRRRRRGWPRRPGGAEEARLAEEARRAEGPEAAATAATTEPRRTRADVVRARREAAGRRERGTTKPRRSWPTLDLSVRTSRILLAVGRTLIAFGTLMLLFVAYELWGTGIHEARAQKQLKRDFNRAITTRTTTPPVTQPNTSTTLAPAVPEGEAVALIEIPKIGINKAVVNGVGVPDLKKGPGHYPDTPLPGEPGNAAVAGHRTTYGAPFNRLDELNPGDEILVTTRAGRFVYNVDTSVVVKPTEVSVLNPTTDNRLTLTTCNPKYSARQRLVVVSHLVGEPPPPPPSEPGQPIAPRRPTIRRSDVGLSGETSSAGPDVVLGCDRGRSRVRHLAARTLVAALARLPARGAGVPRPCFSCSSKTSPGCSRRTSENLPAELDTRTPVRLG